mgnify:CR=1 FL=1
MDEPRTLVFVFLRGGMDGLNTVVPTFDERYRALRPTLALSARRAGLAESGKALPLDERFALHPSLEPLLPLYRDGRLAIAHAVGSDDDTRSHFEAQDQLEHGASVRRPLAGGFLARWLRTREDAGALSALAFGRAVPESLRGAPSVTALESLADIRLNTVAGRERRFAEALGSLYAERRAPGGAELARAGRDALALLERVRDVGSSAEPGVSYPDSAFARSLSQIARLVRAEVGLRAAAVDQGFYDSHVAQDPLLSSQLAQLAEGLAAFDADLGTLRERVTVVCMTEFGRRTYENAGLGTDHGRASCAFLLGGGVRGGRVVADWPGLGDDDREGPGDLRVTTDYRDVLFEVLARRFAAADPETVFPGLVHRAPGLVA